MRSAFQDSELEQHEDQAGHPAPEFDETAEISADTNPDRELTVSTTTLLAVFFGLVLLCGLFFGLGYTFGRRAPADASTPVTVEAASPSYGSQSKPSAAAQPVSPAVSEPEAASAAQTQPEAEASQPAATTQETPVTKPSAPVSDPAPEASEPAAPAGIMVQVAAVSNPADADVLIRALQQHGFSASARHVLPDPLIHVQIGPFANRADAIAMKQKLLGDGYNAILK